MSNVTKYVRDAFKSLDLLEDTEFELNSKEDFEELDDFINADGDIPEKEVIDLEAETEEEVKDSYVGEVILECPICHSDHFDSFEKAQDYIETYKEEHGGEEPELVFEGEACPVCGSEDGFKIIGKVAPFEPEEEEEDEVEVETDDEGAKIEIEDKEEVEEALSFKKRSGRKLKEAKKLTESTSQAAKRFVNWYDNCRDWDLIDRVEKIMQDNDGYDVDEDVDVTFDKMPEEVQAQLLQIVGIRESLGEAKKEVCPNCGKEPCVCEDKELNEAIPSDLAQAYKAANYNEYDSVMSTRDQENIYATGDPSKMSPKEVGPYIDYQKAEYTELTPEQAKALPKNRWKDLRMLKRGKLVVLAPGGGVNSRVGAGEYYSSYSAPEVFDFVDKIYITNEKSGNAFLSADQIAKRRKLSRRFYDPEDGGYGYYRTLDNYYPNSPERLSGRHGAYEVDRSRLGYDARYLDRTKERLVQAEEELRQLEQQYDAGDLSRNEYVSQKERLEARIANYKSDIANGEQEVATEKQRLQDLKARTRYQDVELSMSELQDKLVDLMNSRRSAESAANKARKELNDIENGVPGTFNTTNSWWSGNQANIASKREELQKAYNELKALQARIAQLEGETSGEAYVSQFNAMKDKVAQEEEKLANAQAEIDALLKKNESLTEAKSVDDIEGAVAAVAKKHKDELNAAMEDATDKNSLIKAFSDVMDSHADELSEEGKKRLELAKDQMKKMKSLAAVASFIGTMITGMKINASDADEKEVCPVCGKNPCECKEESKKSGSKDLQERRWKYTLKSGKALRNAIEAEDAQEVLHALRDCIEELRGVLDEDDFEWNFDDILEDIELWIDDPDVDEDEVDYMLEKFYDSCDGLDIWIPIAESKRLKGGRKLKEATMQESIESATIETEDQVINVSSEDKEENMLDDFDPDFSSFDEAGESNGEEMIAPLSDEEVSELSGDSEEEEAEGEEEATDEFPEDEEEVEFEEVQEESFNRLTKSYLNNVYSNVKSFKLKEAKSVNGQLKLTGTIKFNSGKSKDTTFVFEKVADHNSIAKNKVRFVGLNETFTNKQNAYVLRAAVKDGKLVAESLRYNYPAKGKLNESVKTVKGLVK